MEVLRVHLFYEALYSVTHSPICVFDRLLWLIDMSAVLGP